MTRLRKQLPAQQGAGELSYGGFQGPVDYEIRGEPAALRLGPARLHGSLSTQPEVAAEAFRAGEGQLRLESGDIFRITVVGHSAGSGVAYFEMRV
jgi:protein involved in polysaccharide export with SLBB domain